MNHHPGAAGLGRPPTKNESGNQVYPSMGAGMLLLQEPRKDKRIKNRFTFNYCFLKYI